MTIAARADLKNQFDPAADAVGLLLCDLEIIISETERTEINHAEQDQPNEAVIEARPDETGHKDRADNQHATHGGRSLFTTMQFSEAVNFRRSANRLSQFQRDQSSNNKVSKNQREQERRHRGGNGSERDIKKNVEPDEPIAQVMEIVHHGELAIADCEIAECFNHLLCARQATALDQHEIAGRSKFSLIIQRLQQSTIQLSCFESASFCCLCDGRGHISNRNQMIDL